MNCIANFNLQPYNTFGIAATASQAIIVDSTLVLQQSIVYIRHNALPYLIIGGGSNLLLTQNWQGIVLINALKGKEIVSSTPTKTIIAIAGGEMWHEAVEWTLDNNLGGLENLSLIPGTVGAAPMQNIGAYGVEVKDYFHSLEAIHMHTGEKKIFKLEDCKFGYRESVFKNIEKNKWYITKVYFELTNATHHTHHTEYGAISTELASQEVETITIQAISKAVIAIRKSKLPDPAVIGNAGSFFKNPVIELNTWENLKEKYPTMPHYMQGTHFVKIPAGWLIEYNQWKGKQIGNVASHEKQALVLVNKGLATGKEIYDFSQLIIEDIHATFGILLEREVNII